MAKRATKAKLSSRLIGKSDALVTEHRLRGEPDDRATTGNVHAPSHGPGTATLSAKEKSPPVARSTDGLRTKLMGYRASR